MNSQANKTYKVLLAITLATTLAVILWFSSHQQSALSQDSFSANSTRCDFIKTPCHTQNGQQKITLSVSNAVILSFEPLEFTVDLEGANADAVNIDFQGIEMFMGVNKLDLDKITQNKFTGIHTLAGHSDRSMTWRAIINIQTSNNTQQVAFEFGLD